MTTVLHDLQSYYLSSGKVFRKEDTIYVQRNNIPSPIPVESIEEIHLFHATEITAAALRFLGKNGVMVHFYDYYNNHRGTFYPHNKHLSGKVLIGQVNHYSNKEKRLFIARRFLEGAVYNMVRFLSKKRNIDMDTLVEIKELSNRVLIAKNIKQLMGIEGNIHRLWYKEWKYITGWRFTDKRRHPPQNEADSILSFGNSLLYSKINKEIYKTHLTPEVGFLHEAQNIAGKFPLAYDLSEIFKPVIVARVIFTLINCRQITRDSFEATVEGVRLNDDAREIFIEKFDEIMGNTIFYPKYGRKISMEELIRVEVYKLQKHILGDKEYKPLKVWW